MAQSNTGDASSQFRDMCSLTLLRSRNYPLYAKGDFDSGLFWKEDALYAFGVSPDANGASHGYVAAGGPGFTSPTDTVGLAARGR